MSLPCSLFKELPLTGLPPGQTSSFLGHELLLFLEPSSSHYPTIRTEAQELLFYETIRKSSAFEYAFSFLYLSGNYSHPGTLLNVQDPELKLGRWKEKSPQCLLWGMRVFEMINTWHPSG